MLNCSFNFEKFIINEVVFDQSFLTNIYNKKWIVYLVQTFGIWPVFISIQFKLDQISSWQTEYCSYLFWITMHFWYCSMKQKRKRNFEPQKVVTFKQAEPFKVFTKCVYNFCHFASMMVNKMKLRDILSYKRPYFQSLSHPPPILTIF